MCISLLDVWNSFRLIDIFHLQQTVATKYSATLPKDTVIKLWNNSIIHVFPRFPQISQGGWEMYVILIFISK